MENKKKLNISLSGKHLLLGISMFDRTFFNSIIDEYQHMHVFTFNTVLV